MWITSLSLFKPTGIVEFLRNSSKFILVFVLTVGLSEWTGNNNKKDAVQEDDIRYNRVV